MSTEDACEVGTIEDPMPVKAIESVGRVMRGDGMKHGARDYVRRCQSDVWRTYYLSKALKHLSEAINDVGYKDNDSGEYALTHAAARILCVIEALIESRSNTIAS